MFIINPIKSVFAGFGMLLLAFNVSAYPKLSFDGPVTYSAETGQFNVKGGLTGSQDISPVPQFSGSTFQLNALFASVNTSGTVTTASFTGLAGPGSSPVLSIIDGTGTLLKGELSGLVMGGGNGSNQGIQKALFNPYPTGGGSLVSEFSVGAKLFAFQLNLTTPFGPDMFTQNFTGHVDGWLSAPASSVSVPEPGVLVLLMLGLGVIVIVMRKKSAQTFDRHIRELN